MSYFNMVCDSCGREVYGCNIVNGMKFCAKCYQETFGETDKDKQIAELQKQLEEKEMLLQYGKTEIKKLHKRINDIVKRDEKLFKSQPAEIVEKIRKSIHYYPIALLDINKEPRIKTLGISKEVLDNLLQEYKN